MTTCASTADATSVDVLEGQSGVIVMTLRDEQGNLVEKASIQTITLDLYWKNGSEYEVINGRDQQGVLDANGGEYFDTLQTMTDEDGDEVTYNFSWSYEPEDTPFLKGDTSSQPTETHVAHVRFTWDGGAKAISVEVKMNVTNLRRFEVA